MVQERSKNGPQDIGKSRSGWTTKIHMVAADDRTTVTFALSPSQFGDVLEGRNLLRALGNFGGEGAEVLMEKAYEDDEIRQLALNFGMTAVVHPKVNSLTLWKYDRKMYKKRNEVDDFFDGQKSFRRLLVVLKNFVSFLGFLLIFHSSLTGWLV